MSRATRGFTLVEIMVVVVIVGLLATVVAQSVFHYPDEAKLQKTKHDLVVLKDACGLYYLERGSFPEDLRQLVERDEGGRRFLDAAEVPVDPWRGRPYRLLIVGKSVVICCDGPDGQTDTEDDITTENMNTRKV